MWHPQTFENVYFVNTVDFLKNLHFCNNVHRVLESAAHRAALASGAPKIASARASGARKKNSERERERRSEKSGSASGERRS